MIKFYQSQWHGIDFKSFTTCNAKIIADEDFYNDFYREFFIKYKSFNDLGETWLKYKHNIADEIIKQLDVKHTILSIGCGIGVVENYITEKQSNINILAIEPSQNTSRWIKNTSNIILKDGYFPDVLDDNLNIDLAYANAIDYVFDDVEYLKFLKSVVDYGINDFLMISVSYYKPSLKLFVKEFIKDIVTSFGLYKRGQFWGYLRTIEEQINFMKLAGFDSVSLEYQSEDTIILKGKIRGV